MSKAAALAIAADHLRELGLDEQAEWLADAEGVRRLLIEVRRAYSSEMLTCNDCLRWRGHDATCKTGIALKRHCK